MSIIFGTKNTEGTAVEEYVCSVWPERLAAMRPTAPM